MSCESERVLSVVVIGLNEQDRLKASLDAVFLNRPEGYELEVLYVDSGSTDRSVEIARSVPGVAVLHLEGGRPSAARARNLGLRQARGPYVQLIDGDSVVQPGWMARALEFLEARPDASCAFGQIVEMHPEQSTYMKVCGLDWHIPPGERRFCGGNSMWRRSVIAANGFFDEGIQVGEEPELCYRVRHAGGRIVCLDLPMVEHDLGMHTFGQYWGRSVSSGRAYASIAARFWRNPEKMWLRETLVNFAEPAAWLVIFAAAWLVFGAAVAVVVILAWWLGRALQIATTLRRRRVALATAVMYGLHCQFARFPAALGQLKALSGRR
ncbi:MAG: glycosyltransferase family A protein [Caldimonas sp.]